MNVETGTEGTQFLFLGIHKSKFLWSVAVELGISASHACVGKCILQVQKDNTFLSIFTEKDKM